LLFLLEVAVIQDSTQSSFGLSPNVAAGIASFFTWLGGLIILLGKPPQQWVRFVAVQSIVTFVAYVVFMVADGIIIGMLNVAHLWPIAGLFGLLYMVAGVVYFVVWLIMTIQAFQGKAWRVPFIAQWADRWVPATQNL
jgi:uncharacterized membrane protein